MTLKEPDPQIGAGAVLRAPSYGSHLRGAVKRGPSYGRSGIRRRVKNQRPLRFFCFLH